MGTCRHVDLLLIRHGLTQWNQDKRYLGHTDQGLLHSELPILDGLKSELKLRKFDHIFTSDLKRCLETFHYFDFQQEPILDHRLREMNFGDWEGKTYTELKDMQTYRNWLDNWELTPVPNGESAPIFKARIDSFFQELFHDIDTQKETQKILIITHGGVIRYTVSKYVASSSFWNVSITHGQGLQISFEKKEGEWRCSSFLEVLSQEKEK